MTSYTPRYGQLTDWELKTLEQSSAKDKPSIKTARFLFDLSSKQFEGLCKINPAHKASYHVQFIDARAEQRVQLIDELGWTKFKRILDAAREEDAELCPHCGREL